MTIGHCWLRSTKFKNQHNCFSPNREHIFAGTWIYNATSILSPESNIQTAPVPGGYERRCVACSRGCSSDYTYCLNPDCNALHIGLNAQGDFIVWRYGIKIGTLAQFRDPARPADDEMKEVFKQRMHLLLEMCRMAVADGWNPGIGRISMADDPALDPRAPRTITQEGNYTVAPFTSDRSNVLIWSSALPPGLNADQQQDLRMISVARDQGHYVSPAAVRDTKIFAGFRSQPSVCASLGINMVKTGLSNCRKCFADCDTPDAASEVKIRLRQMAETGKCHVHMKPCYSRYDRADGSCINIRDIVPYDYRDLDGIFHHYFESGRVVNMTSLEALVAVFCWYYAFQIQYDDRGDHEDPVPLHIRYYYTADKTIFRLNADQTVEINLDFQYHVNMFLFNIQRNEEFDANSIKNVMIDGMVAEQLRFRPTDKTRPHAKAAKQHTTCARSLDGVMGLARESTSEASSEIGTGLLERGVRQSKAKLSRAGPAAPPMQPSAPCIPKQDFFTRGRPRREWYRTLTQPSVRRRLEDVLRANAVATAASAQSLYSVTPDDYTWSFSSQFMMAFLLIFLTHIMYHMLASTTVVLPLYKNWDRRTVAYSLWLQTRATTARVLYFTAWLLQSLAYVIQPALVMDSPSADTLTSPLSTADQEILDVARGGSGRSAVNDTASSPPTDAIVIPTCEMCGAEIDRSRRWCLDCSYKVCRIFARTDTEADREFREGPFVAIAHQLGLERTFFDTSEVAYAPSPRLSYDPTKDSSASSSSTDSSMPALETPRGQTSTTLTPAYPAHVDVHTGRVIYDGFSTGSVPLDVTLPFGPLESTGGTESVGTNTELSAAEYVTPIPPAPLPVSMINELNELHNLHSMVVHGGVYLHPSTYTVHLFNNCSAIVNLPMNRPAINCHICGNCRRRRTINAARIQGEDVFW